MKKLVVLSLFLVFIGVVSNELFEEHHLVLQWPQSYCDIAGQPERYPCRSAEHPYFTIHGLWPQKNKQKVDCTDHRPHPEFNYDLIDGDSKLLKDLKHFWPNLTSTKIEEGNKEFWANEWEKHGTCTTGKFGDGDEAEAQMEYFKRAVDLAKTVPLTKRNELIKYLVPGNQYTTKDITDAIVKATIYTPRLVCKNKGKKQDNNVQKYLYEVKLCVDERAEGLKHCDYDAASCGLKSNIEFPKVSTGRTTRPHDEF